MEEPVDANGFMNMACHCKGHNYARSECPSSSEENSDCEKKDNVGVVDMVCNKEISKDLADKQVLQQPRFGVEIAKLSAHSIYREHEKYFGCLVGYLLDYSSISAMEMQVAIDDCWSLEGRVTVLKKNGKYYILRPETFSDWEDLAHASLWNINGAMLLLWPWEPDVPLRFLNFSIANIWVQISGAPLEYITPGMVVRMASLIAEVTIVDRGTITKENLEYMRVRVNVPIMQPLILGDFLRLEQGRLVQFGYEKLTFFVRHAEFVASDDDPTEPSSGDDDNPMEPSSGDDDSQASDRTVTEPLNLVLGEDIVVDSGIAIQNGMDSEGPSSKRPRIAGLDLNTVVGDEHRTCNATVVGPAVGEFSDGNGQVARTDCDLGKSKGKRLMGPDSSNLELASSSSKKPHVAETSTFFPDLDPFLSLGDFPGLSNPPGTRLCFSGSHSSYKFYSVFSPGFHCVPTPGKRKRDDFLPEDLGRPLKQVCYGKKMFHDSLLHDPIFSWRSLLGKRCLDALVLDSPTYRPRNYVMMVAFMGI
ncbi:hypothetical protein Vadar_024716 [Vaccinium darrowii]|uniref:Uncharacterized protein n=1 Tax=Vaccinium darrowii TaxID=229202 RepID=A0ACB7Z6C6_9ERIC|nr:hypothetical protein Vadar_024716 [Vaccinium darrowii]